MRSGVLAFTFLCGTTALGQHPRIDSISPSQGPISGGTIVSIRGANFAGSSVMVDATIVIPVSKTDSEIRVAMTKHDNGYVTISVQNNAGKTQSEFLYVPPRLDEIRPGFITTVAGVGRWTGDGRPAREVFVEALHVAYDSKGLLYIREPQQGRLRRVSFDGTIETVPAVDNLGKPVTGPAIAIDGNDDVYIAGGSKHNVAKIDVHTNVATVVAGTGAPGFSGDGGPATLAQFNLPNRAAVARTGEVFVLDFGNARVRRISRDGIITTVAGNGMVGTTGDGGPATAASINQCRSAASGTTNTWWGSTAPDATSSARDASELVITQSRGPTLFRISSPTAILLASYSSGKRR